MILPFSAERRCETFQQGGKLPDPADVYKRQVLILSHMLSEIELIADDIGILNHGRLLFEGSLNELRQSALRAGFAADNLEDMFLSMVEKDNAARKQRAQL